MISVIHGMEGCTDVRWLDLSDNKITRLGNTFIIDLLECMLFNANLAIFLLFHGKNKLILNEMIMRSA